MDGGMMTPMTAEQAVIATASPRPAVAIFATLNGVLAQIVMASRMLFGAARDVPALAPTAAPLSELDAKVEVD